MKAVPGFMTTAVSFCKGARDNHVCTAVLLSAVLVTLGSGLVQRTAGLSLGLLALRFDLLLISLFFIFAARVLRFLVIHTPAPVGSNLAVSGILLPVSRSHPITAIIPSCTTVSPHSIHRSFSAADGVLGLA